MDTIKTIPVLGIPHLNRPDLLMRCVESIDHPVERLVVVVNGPVSEFPLLEFNRIAGLIRENGRYTTVAGGVIHHLDSCQHRNAGVASSWNEIIKLFPAPFWMLVNNDIQFSSGDLGKMSQFVNEEIKGFKREQYQGGNSNLPSKTTGVIYGNHGASWYCITADCVAQAGLMDECIHPAYLEDCDYSRRCDLMSIRRCDAPDVHALHGMATDPADQTKGSCTIKSDPELEWKNGITHGINFEYYRAKWGGINGEEKFKTPFNDPHWPVWAWKFDPQLRQRQTT